MDHISQKFYVMLETSFGSASWRLGMLTSDIVRSPWTETKKLNDRDYAFLMDGFSLLGCIAGIGPVVVPCNEGNLNEPCNHSSG